METFQEDIIQTFLFCFLVAMGIIQIMVARRSWHGLAIYGGRVRKNVNYAMGVALIIFGYAWYFSNPLHRNTRNIEGIMSIVCLVFGIAAAVALTAVLASLSDAIRRRRGRGAASFSEMSCKRIALSGGEAFLRGWGDRGQNLVVLAEPGKGSEQLLARTLSVLPPRRGLLAIIPSAMGKCSWPALLRELEQREGLELSGEIFAGMGWSSNELARLQEEMEETYKPKGFLAVAPVIPDYSQKTVGDAFESNTPMDICTEIMEQRPWRSHHFKRILNLWVPVFLACSLIATALTVAFDVRWKYVFGPAMGLILSLWVAYYIAAWRGLDLKGRTAEVDRMPEMALFPAAGSGYPSKTVLISDDCLAFKKLPESVKSGYPDGQIEFWSGVLRGKFLLEAGTLSRLANLIWEEPEQPGMGN
ncbi:MAG: hypothetical protein A2W01_01030 [Candidatus Solincola sediminis]|uniref:Uncharacterized protein n=1 Tax=Candidatus Solincola sediminis TaxID=1797199 RepID=A0A1F2WJ95_9ACTN|nr:MAG: hypothetical protein A2Y75_07185 [Candidatus Solincola sediminis]OFW59639.1 MAG: hypothetical protein A2W01_01030 [Candidatus Solincola sediminis]